MTSKNKYNIEQKQVSQAESLAENRWVYKISSDDSDFPPVDDDDDDDMASHPRSFSDMLSEASRMLNNAMQKQQTRILDNEHKSDTPLLD